MFKLPKEINIGGVIWKVKEVLSHEYADRSGICLQNQLEIHVLKVGEKFGSGYMNIRMQEIAYYHEVLHAAKGFFGDLPEEQFCDVFGGVIMKIVRNSKKKMIYMHKDTISIKYSILYLFTYKLFIFLLTKI
jgi:hypothetical protein